MIEASLCRLHYPYIKRYRQHESNKVVFIQTRRIFAPGVSVGSKLHFWACICLSFFYAIIGLSHNCFFSRYARDAAFSHMYAELKKAFVYVV